MQDANHTVVKTIAFILGDKIIFFLRRKKGDRWDLSNRIGLLLTQSKYKGYDYLCYLFPCSEERLVTLQELMRWGAVNRPHCCSYCSSDIHRELSCGCFWVRVKECLVLECFKERAKFVGWQERRIGR